MRKIKFRAWHDQDKEMVFFKNEKLVNDQHQMQHLAHLINGDYGNVLMQFTGLKDKNGVEIYESDIAKCQPRGIKDLGIFTVRYDRVYGSYVLIFNKWCGLNVSSPENYPLGEGRFDIEVVGNIYENPELLKSPSN